MRNFKNAYINFLIEEVKRNSRLPYDSIFKEVRLFSTTKEFESSFLQWKSFQKEEKFIGPHSMKSILKEMGS